MKKTKEEEQCRTAASLLETLEDVKLSEKKGTKFYFRLHMTDHMHEASLEELDLSVRSSNCLHRAGYFTIGQLVDALVAGLDLKSIRNCGETSVREIMEHLFLYQYDRFDKQLQENYLLETVVYNLQKQLEQPGQGELEKLIS